MEFKNFIPESWTQFKTLFKKFFKKTFVGTRAEWNLLSVAEKTEYDICNLTDDLAGGELIITDAVTDGDLNPVTSNAVYDAMKPNVIERTLTFNGVYGEWAETQVINIPKGKWIFTMDTHSSVGVQSAGLVSGPQGWMVIPKYAMAVSGTERMLVSSGVFTTDTDTQIGLAYYCYVSSGDTLELRFKAIRVGNA